MVEGIHQAVVVFLGHRIVFVIVALGAGNGQSEPVGGRDVDAVEEDDETLFLGDGSSFPVVEVIAIESAGDFLLDCGIG